MDIKEQIHGLSEEMIENLGKGRQAIWRRTGRGASCGT